MKFLKTAGAIGLAVMLVSSLMVSEAEAARRKRTRRVRPRKSSNVTEIFDYNLRDTGDIFDFSYEGNNSDGLTLKGSGSFITTGENAPIFTESKAENGLLNFTLLIENVAGSNIESKDNIDVQIEYEFSDVLSVLPELKTDTSVQNILDFLAVGNNNGYDIYDDTVEDLDQFNTRFVSGGSSSISEAKDTGSTNASFLRFGRASENGIFTPFDFSEDNAIAKKIGTVNSAYDNDSSDFDDTLLTDGEPLNEIDDGDEDQFLLAFGDDLEQEVPEPSSLMGLFLLVSAGLGRSRLLRTRNVQ